MWLGQEQGISKKGLLSCFGLDMGHGKRGRSREKGLLSCLASGLGRGRKRGRRNRGFPKKAFFCLTSFRLGKGERGKGQGISKKAEKAEKAVWLGHGKSEERKAMAGVFQKGLLSCLAQDKPLQAAALSLSLSERRR